MYAYTATSYRAIRDPADAQPGETVAEAVPQTILDAISAVETQRSTTATSIRQQAEAALVDLRAFRDLASPTNAQILAAAKLNTRVNIGVIRLLLSKLDATD